MSGVYIRDLKDVHMHRQACGDQGLGTERSGIAKCISRWRLHAGIGPGAVQDRPVTVRLSEPGASISPGLGRPLRGYQPATGRPLRRLSSHAASGLRQHRRLGLHPPGSLFVHSCRRAGSGA